MGTLFSVLSWIITGSAAGYLASLILGAKRTGCITNILLGIAGAFVGGFVMGQLLGFTLTGAGWIDSIFNATVGAVILLIVMEFVLPGKQLGVREDDGKGSRKRRR